jgi:two-component system, cell cycle response regulator
MPAIMENRSFMEAGDQPMSGKILIVDDVATNRIVYKVKLAAAFYEPITAGDGAGCLKAARLSRPDLILVGPQLSDMSVIDLLHALRSDPITAAVPVIVLSRDGDPAARLAALAAGADDVVRRTVEDQTLFARMRNLIRWREWLPEFEAGRAAIRALGLAEPGDTFEHPGSFVLITDRPDLALKWRHKLEPVLRGRISTMTLEQALHDPPVTAAPDVFIVEAGKTDRLGGLQLLSDLRSRGQTRHAAICILRSEEASCEAAIAYDLGANDIVAHDISAHEFALRLKRLLGRKREADHMRASVRDGLRMAVVDPLTGLFNRRYALQHLAGIAQLSRDTGLPFAVMVVDLDRFKQVNDAFGHPAGDAVLVEVAQRMTAALRSEDLLARIGGEEFLIALPATDLATARRLADRVCAAISAAPIALPGQKEIGITASAGLALCNAAQSWITEDVTQVIDRADKALMVAKAEGRNQVTISLSAA